MATQALDFVTVGHALNELSATHLPGCKWLCANSEQERFLAWYSAHREEIDNLTGLAALASTNWVALNAFLETNRFQPLFRPFNGVGVVSILDMLVEWLARGVVTTVRGYDATSGQHTLYPAFKLGPEGAEAYDVAGCDQPLLRLYTTTGHSLWLMKADAPASGIDLALTVQRLLDSHRSRSAYWVAGVKVPMLEIDVQPDLDWLCGAYTVHSAYGYHRIVQAFQQFKLRANERGVRVKVSTGVATTRSAATVPTPYEFNEPFVGCFTQLGHDRMPLAAFWADTDSWRSPDGTLEAL